MRKYALLLCVVLCSTSLLADSFSFSTGTPDGQIGTASRPAGNGQIQIETADDFILSSPTLITGATFYGLLPSGAPLSIITQVEIEFYHVFPVDSTFPPSGNVPTRTNSPSDVEIGSATRDSLAGSLGFSASIVSAAFTVANTVVDGIHPSPSQFTGGEGSATGEEVRFTVTFNTPVSLPADHYFFRPEVGLSSGTFLVLSATRPTNPPLFTGDLQSWIRNDNLAPDWLRIGTDITHQGPFNAAFSLSGETVPEPSSLLLLGTGLLGISGAARRKLRLRFRDRVIWGQAKLSRYLVALCCLCVSAWIFPSRSVADDLFVGNFFGPGNENVLRFNGSTGAFVSTFVPTGSGGLTFPLGGTFGPDGNFYVSNSDGDDVLRYNGTTGAFLNVFASSVEDAAGLAFGPDNNLYVANSTSPGSITKLNGTTGALITELTGGGLSDPEGIAFGPDHNLYVANGDGNNVLRFNGSTGAFMNTFVTAGSGGLLSARDLTFGADGNLYVTSFGTGEVLEYSGTTGAFIKAFVVVGSGGLSFPRPLAFGPDGNLYVGSFGSGDILRYNGSTGAFLDAFVSAGAGGLGGPTFLVFNEGPSSAVPEPSTFGLLICGLAGLAMWKRKQ